MNVPCRLRGCSEPLGRLALFAPAARYALKFNDPTSRIFRWPPPTASKRHLHTSKVQSATVAADTNNAYETEAGVVLQSNPFLKNEDALKGTPSIRDHLGAWYKSEVKSRSEIVTSIPATGRIRELPDSLFLHDTAEEEWAEGMDEAVVEFEELIEGSGYVAALPGDLRVLKPPNAGLQFAIYIGPVGKQLQYILKNGRFCQISESRLQSIVCSNFLSQDVVDEIREGLPKKELLRDQTSQVAVNVAYAGQVPDSIKAVCNKVGAKMQDFEEEVLAYRRSHTLLLDTLYERVAAQDEYKILSFDHFVQSLLGVSVDRLSDASRMAIFELLQNNPTKIQPTGFGYTSTVELVLIPKDLSAQMDKVVGWAREYQEMAALAAKGQSVQQRLKKNPVNQFINKARSIIIASRKLRKPTSIGILGPSSQAPNQPGKVLPKSTGYRFSEDDKCILEFMFDTYMRSPKRSGLNQHHASASLILRAIGAYPRMTLEKKIGLLLMQELGCVAPWAEPSDHDIILPLPGRRGAESSTRLWREGERYATSLGFRDDSDEIFLPDSMADLRVDLWDIPVYVIDGKTTDVPDDGVSIEESKDRPGCYWFHVHVAHASAYFGPKTLFGRVAESQAQSWYLTKTTYPMLPHALSRSLRLRSGGACLTTSTLLDENGNVMDVRIRPTRVHNVIRLDPVGVDPLLGSGHFETTSLTVGGDLTPQEQYSQEEIQAEMDRTRPHLPLIRKGLELIQIRGQKRRSEQPVVLDMIFQENTLSASVNFLEEYERSRLYNSIHYHGDPTIRLAAATSPPVGGWMGFVNNRNIVHGAMVMAGESAGKWFRDRSLSAVFAGSRTLPGFSVSKLNATSLHSRITRPRSTSGPDPIPHVTMNVDQYIRFTSPIRRYGDLLAQWNADSYLRAVAEGVVEDGQPLPESYPVPFPRDAVAEYVKYEGTATVSARRINARSRQHWAFQALFRAKHFNEAELPDEWDAQVVGGLEETLDYPAGLEPALISGLLLPFCMKAVFLRSEQGWELNAAPGEYMPVKLEMVDTTMKVCFVKPVGPPSKTQTRLHSERNWMSKERRQVWQKEGRLAANRPITFF
jgi:hypothetical protein